MTADGGGRWVARPRAAALVRVLVVVVPAVAGALAAWVMAGLLPEPSGLAETVGWWAAVIAAAVAAVLLVKQLARRLLPLAWLLTLTLAFPDRAPSRLATARRAASRRARRQALAALSKDGLAREAPAAAEQALVLVAALGAHDRRTRGHSERVRGLADALAEETGLSASERDRLRWAALLHDIGKLVVPGEILNKPDRPDEAEWAALRRHPEEGGRLVEPLVAWLGPWSGAVGQHHERWDGTGYPQGLAGQDISLGGRILAIADAYEVMTAARPYKQPLGPVAARQELVAGAGAHFDPALVRSFLGISLGRLWWLVGASALLAQIPLVGKAWAAPGVGRLREGLSGPATATAAVAALALAGVVSPAGAPPAAPAVAARDVPASTGVPPSTPAGEAPITAVAAGAAPHSEGGGPAPEAPDSTTASPSIGAPVTTAPPAGPTPTPPGSPAEGPGPAPAPDPQGPGGGGGAAYTATGQLVAPGFLALVGLGLTEGEFRSDCTVPSSQGLDAHVFDLPPEVRVAGAPVRVNGRDLLGLHDLDVVFYSDDCTELGRLTEGGPDETGTLPAGTRFVVVTDRRGIDTAVELTVGPTG